MYIIEYLLFLYFLSSVAYVGLFSLAARLVTYRKLPTVSTYQSIAVLVPAYQEDQVILSVVDYLLKQEYPSDYYDIIIIADSFQPQTLEQLSQYPIVVLEVDFEKSTKAKSLNYALSHLEAHYDIAIISDADNVPESRFLAKVNDAFQQGFSVLQGKRVAKNQNTSFTLLDAASEIINNHIFRKGYNAIGLSSALIGSGMAFPFAALKEQMAKIHAVGGFDRELQLAFIEQRVNIKYLEDALVFDEKVSNSQAFENQRRRWLSSQFIYLRKYFIKGIKQLLAGNVSYFNIAVLYNIYLPRLLNLGMLVVLALGATLLQSALVIPILYWWLLPVVYSLSLLIALPTQFYNRDFFRAIVRLPGAFLIMLRSFLRMKGADKKFIHTTHTETQIDNSTFYREQ